MKTKRAITNIAASVRQRLYNRARERGENFNLVVPRYAVERLLYRLSRSQYADEFVLKGAQLFHVWIDSPHIETIRKFMMPPVLSLVEKQTFKKIWTPGVGWRMEK